MSIEPTRPNVPVNPATTAGPTQSPVRSGTRAVFDVTATTPATELPRSAYASRGEAATGAIANRKQLIAWTASVVDGAIWPGSGRLLAAEIADRAIDDPVIRSCLGITTSPSDASQRT